MDSRAVVRRFPSVQRLRSRELISRSSDAESDVIRPATTSASAAIRYISSTHPQPTQSSTLQVVQPRRAGDISTLRSNDTEVANHVSANHRRRRVHPLDRRRGKDRVVLGTAKGHTEEEAMESAKALAGTLDAVQASTLKFAVYPPIAKRNREQQERRTLEHRELCLCRAFQIPHRHSQLSRPSGQYRRRRLWRYRKRERMQYAFGFNQRWNERRSSYRPATEPTPRFVDSSRAHWPRSERSPSSIPR